MTLRVGRAKSVALLLSCHEGDIVAVVPQRQANDDQPDHNALYGVGSFAKVVRIDTESAGSCRVILEGLARLRFDHLDHTDPYWVGSGRALDDEDEDSEEAEFLAKALREQLAEHAKNAGGALDEALKEKLEPSEFADRIAASMDLETPIAVELLATASVTKRLRRLAELLGKAAHRAELWREVERDVKTYFSQQQREAVIREQMRALRKALGDEDGPDELEKLREKIEAAGLSPAAQEIAKRELKRLSQLGAQHAETHVIRNYLEWLAALPWEERASVSEDLNLVAQQLDDDHFGLDEPKRRILEHLAVYKLSGHRKGTILCLVGPPGVGKTSIARSIATATNRPFIRIALGGVRDEAELRGHRRTYVGALPGRLIHALRQAKAKNPVILLDEIDKLGADFRGSPESALLEILDPEQNVHFTDHYLETPFDLSEVQFICTANSLDTLSRPLRDRLDLVEVSGYTETEKLKIARKYLIPKRLQEAGLPADRFDMTDDVLRLLIHDYTREAGVRQVDRELSRLVRAYALEIARAPSGQNSDEHLKIDAERLATMLGKPKFRREPIERNHVPGVATGLAWTPFGGDILYIETSIMPGHGKLEITGQLGDVMKESARAALTYVRSHADALQLDAAMLEKSDLHIHVPAGAVPKDGPSAGVTMFTALASLLSQRPVRADTAMTGECTLRGRVLPVGGIKAKVLAAHRAGMKRILLPQQNGADLDEVPQDVRNELEILLVEDMSEVLAFALEPTRVDGMHHKNDEEIVNPLPTEISAAVPTTATIDPSNGSGGAIH
jgi:ATP-dependent Lon protease